MDTSYSISVVLFIILLPAFVVLEILHRSSKSIQNSDFGGYEILESNILRKGGVSLIRCSSLCTERPSCLSLNYNKITKTCVLFDKDFTNITGTASSYCGDSWFYYYLIRDAEMRSVQCSAPFTIDVCSLFCLYYIHIYDIYYAQLESGCNASDGGEMVIVDRQLKQHCVQDLMVRQSHFNYIYIQGKRGETTNAWKYNDGRVMTYFNWNNGQPENRIGEKYVGVMAYERFRWNDVYDDLVIHATICQQT